MIYTYCFYYLKKIMIEVYSDNTLNIVFWKIAQAKTWAKYTYYIDEL